MKHFSRCLNFRAGYVYVSMFLTFCAFHQLKVWCHFLGTFSELCRTLSQIDVLKEIGCIDADLVVQIKGRVACEMNSGEELICTECLFENQLDDLEPEEAVALMSAFVFQQKNTSEPSLTPKLSKARQRFNALFWFILCFTIFS